MSDVDGMAHAIRSASLDGVFTRRQYMVRKLLLINPSVSMWVAIEAVSSTAMSHKEWDMDEQRTWDEWEAALSRGREREKEEESE